MNLEKLTHAIDRIRDHAVLVEQSVGEDAARGLRWAADEFEAALEDWLNEALTITEAAKECHWEASTIAKKIRAGELRQEGKLGETRIRRRDLFLTISETQLSDLLTEVLSDAAA